VLDTVTLRVVFSLIALTLLTLFSLAIFRPTRAPYAGWWCLSLALFLLGNALYLTDDTSWQRLGNPLGNALLVAGGASIWSGARSLRGLRPAWWAVAAGPLLVGVASGLDHPATNRWSGGLFFIGAMAIYFGLTSREMWLLHRGPRTNAEDASGSLAGWMAGASAVISLFYVARWFVFAAAGQSSRAFSVWLGSQTSVVLTTVLLVVAGFTMSALSNEQRMGDLRSRATRDALTGLLNRGELLGQARALLERCGREGGTCVLIMADLDHFKDINDRHGHGVGDRALQSFADACASALGKHDIAGRIGGEEFALLLPDIEPIEAERVTQRISDRYRLTAAVDGVDATVSYGIAPLEVGLDLEILMDRADSALYRAKSEGRDRAIHHRG